MADKITRIALTGKMRSGKSVAAGHLTEHYGFQKVSFGGALKRYSDDIFANSDVYPAEELTKPCPFGGVEVIGKKKPRKLYQDFGTALRQLDPNVWVQHAAVAVSVWEGLRKTRGIVIDDLRQPNEYDWCRENGFTIIRLVADEETRIERIKAKGDDYAPENMTHDTEMHSDGFEVDHEIINNGSYADFLAEIDGIMDGIATKGTID